MTEEELIEAIKDIRREAERTMPSPKAIGTAFATGKTEQAARTALHREFRRGQVQTCERLLALINERNNKQ